MRMSCNGCRVLRKGCSENCCIRPCLQWIKTPESQANATVFLAKFYGRAGLINLINAGPDHLRPAIFRSLLYEACGRIVNPIYGSVGLLWSGSWQLCQAAVEAVLKGAPIVQISSESAVQPHPPLKTYDIRHVSKDDPAHAGSGSGPAEDLHKLSKSRTRFKRSGASAKPKHPEPAKPGSGSAEDDASPVCNLRWFERAASHDSSACHGGTEPSRENESAETEETWVVSRADERKPQPDSSADESEVELELTLGFEPHHQSHSSSSSPARTHVEETASVGVDTCRTQLGLDIPA
ncbi:LOB domain-containing protein 41 [Acorus gramineus]|uniref:LOB domain-containing protein 41 n=1 Tax=Acorus gramineus TaxID=55184 RepID=A0AAV9AXH7_ACOGR|nr:LOB domain-containing protein 41 [Acorus gramineus]